jgi:hypothetical protein
VVLTDERLHNADAGDLLGQLAQHLVVVLALELADLANVFEEEQIADHVERDQRDDHDGELPLEREQHQRNAHQGDEVADEGDQLALDQALDQLDVARGSGHDLAGLGLVVEGQREPLKVFPEREPQVEDEAVADPVQVEAEEIA